MTEQEFEEFFDGHEQQYGDFIMKHADPSERIIANGDDLIDAMEDEYLFEEFKAFVLDTTKSVGMRIRNKYSC